MNLKSAAKTIGWIAGGLAVLWVFFSIGDLVKGVVPTRYHDMVLRATGLAVIVAALLHFWFRDSRYRPGSLPGPVVTRIAIGLFATAVVFSMWFDIDDGCYVDWDGRGNPVVCE